jgi:hypothetical protein
MEPDAEHWLAKKTNFLPKYIFCRRYVCLRANEGRRWRGMGFKETSAASLKSFYQNAAIS